MVHPFRVRATIQSLLPQSNIFSVHNSWLLFHPILLVFFHDTSIYFTTNSHRSYFIDLHQSPHYTTFIPICQWHAIPNPLPATGERFRLFHIIFPMTMSCIKILSHPANQRRSKFYGRLFVKQQHITTCKFTVVAALMVINGLTSKPC